jgi:4'-phosphopantetheinyl transferase
MVAITPVAENSVDRSDLQDAACMDDLIPHIGQAPALPGEPAVHVWLLQLELGPAAIAAIEPDLSPEEQQRAKQLRFDRDRIRFIAAHGGLRRILGAYLQRTPREVAIVTDERRKPRLAPVGQAADLRFNLSHSGEWGLLAIGRQRHIGVDIEQVRPVPELLDVAKSVLSSPEMAALMARTESDRLGHFLAMWTRKEAAVKAVGAGLAADLPQVQIRPADPGECQRFEVTAGLGGVLYGQRLQLLDGYHAAVVVDGAPPETAVRHWPNTPLPRGNDAPAR